MSSRPGLFKKGSPAEALWKKIDRDRLPRHIAIIMDGNGRWARRRHLPRVAGHQAGVKVVRHVVEVCAQMGIPVLTLYAFSLDNWKRPRQEVDFLMKLLRDYVRKELKTLERNNICLRVIGRWQGLPQEVQADVAHALEATSRNTGMRLVVALNYSARAELVDAVNALLEAHRRNGFLGRVEEPELATHLYTHDLPDPDLLIRTSGEMRVSNFLLWQIAYSEIWVTDTLWPEFTDRHLLQAIYDYQQRERRYGAISPEQPEPPGAAIRPESAGLGVKR
ncbi:MAG: isoprenyl transferase [Acidobacteria bacterium]|nr:isoprenyl transferase [Acidobacteriota bacterium]